MWWIIIAIIFILITVCVLKDTHVKVYVGYCYTKLQEEYDLKLPVWALLLIVLVYLIPGINIIVFVVFLVFYIIHAVWDPKECKGETHVFSLNGNNWITKACLQIKEILNKKI
jgi:TRAP-type mannitol/chloroaromatic compound transport system permease small subunit